MSMRLDPSTLKAADHVIATFQPAEAEILPGLINVVGWRGEWVALSMVPEGLDRAGEWLMRPVSDGKDDELLDNVFALSRDLVDVEPVVEEPPIPGVLPFRRKPKVSETE